MTLFPGVALITGAGSGAPKGIGRKVALSFVAEGCRRLALLDQDEAGVAESLAQCRDVCADDVKVCAYRCNVSSEAEVREAMSSVKAEFGRIDYAVNCAGIFSLTGPSHELSPEHFDRITAVNYRGIWLTSRAEAAQMLAQEPLPTHDGRPGNRGAIVNFASNLAVVSRADCPAYCGSKAAVLGLTRSDAIDYAPHNIRVNCVCPGIIDTPMTKDLPRDNPCIAISPMKRMGTAQEVADAVLFLCSSKATYVNGHAMCVDGGYVIN